MQPLYQARDRIEAQFLRDLLAENRIETALLGDYLAGAAGELPVNIWPEVWVLEETDLPRARVLLGQFLSDSGSVEGADWVCAACGQRVEGAFELCWNCSRPRE